MQGMKRLIQLWFLGALLATAGCSLSDMLFSVFGDHYSSGGTPASEKRWD
jgi:hypothetical protein